MKISISISILTIFVILLVNGCNTDNSVEPILNPKSVSIKGYIYCDSVPVADAVLKMDTLITTTDSLGYYVFYNVTGDTFHIAVNHPEFDAFEFEVLRENPSVQDINLTRTHYDYFPLRIGNKWKFSYTSGGYAGSPTSGYTSWSSTGSIYWEITAKEIVSTNQEYSLSEKYYDSSGVLVQDTTLKLIYDTNKNVTVNGWSRILRNNPSFRRYEPISSDETIMYFFIAGGNGDYTLKRKTGLIRFSLSYSGITMGYSSYAELLEFTGH